MSQQNKHLDEMIKAVLAAAQKGLVGDPSLVDFTTLLPGRPMLPFLRDLAEPTPEAQARLKQVIGAVLELDAATLEVRQAAHQLQSHIAADLFTGRDTATEAAVPDEAAPGLTFADLEAAVGKLKAMGPIAVAIWFVDRPAEYDSFVGQVGYLLPRGTDPVWVMTGIPVILWQMTAFDPEEDIIAEREQDRRELFRQYAGEKIVWPWFVKEPGIWVEMSDGNHYRLDIRGWPYRRPAIT